MSILVYSISKSEAPQNNFIELSKNNGYIYWDNAKFKKTNPGDKVFVTNLSKGDWYLTELITNDIKVTKNFEKDSITFNDDGISFTVPGAERWGDFVKLKILEVIEGKISPYKNAGAGCSTFMANDGGNGAIRIKQLLKVFDKQTTPKAVLLLNRLLNNINNGMFKFYLKKVSNQDKTRTTVINNDALHKFFGVSLNKRNDEVKISVQYVSDGVKSDNVVLSKKQDIRIFLDRDRYEKDDILLFSSKDDNKFDLEIINTFNENYEIYLLALKNNYLITNYLPVNGLLQSDLFNQKQNSTKMNYPLNQILYGPPGTGKTYSTITKALEIIGTEYNNYEEAQKLFQNELGKRIEFVTMHQSFSYEDFVQGLKPLPSVDNKGVVFDYKNGVFKEICDRADENRLLVKSNAKRSEIIIDKLFPSFFLSIDENSVYEILKKYVFGGQNVPQYLAIEFFNKKLGKKYCKAWRDKFDYVLGDKSPRVGYQPDKFRDGELENFRKYSEEFEKLTPENREKKLIKEWIHDKPKMISTSSQSSNHVIILDEINRANISRVFGELIALIEKDKRDGKLTATLPSGEAFTVPSNLHIIGTMNTADKSIALVDIALRRRFEFIPLYPNSNTLKKVLKEKGIKDVEQRVALFTNLNKIIRAKKSVDFEIGHSYFMDEDTLVNILNKQVLPLLNEYFMYDLRKVQNILEKPQKDRDGNEIPKLDIELDKDIWKNRGLLEVKSFGKIVEVKKAIELEGIKEV